jgi:hypothetical protein
MDREITPNGVSVRTHKFLRIALPAAHLVFFQIDRSA